MGFPSVLILGEDTYVGLQMLLAGWSVSCCANALSGPPASTTHYAKRKCNGTSISAYRTRAIPELLQQVGEPEGTGLRFVHGTALYEICRRGGLPVRR